MKVTIEEFVISGEGLTKEHGAIYEHIGLDVAYDSHNIRIYSTNRAKIISLGGGIHVHALYSTLRKLTDSGFISANGKHTMPFEMLDKLGNKIILTFIGEHPQNTIAIITSGGDAPGMNAAIKSIVRSSIRWGSTVYGVYRGFDGLINDYICKLGWDTETHSSAEGGTVLLSFRSKSFYKREVRKQAVLNLVKRNINCLIILGGDGSLKGALTLKKEFKTFFRELIQEGKLTQEDLQEAYGKKANLKRSMMDVDEIEHYEKFYGEPECYKEIPKINASRYPPLDTQSTNTQSTNTQSTNTQSTALSDNQSTNSLSSALSTALSDSIEDFIYDLKIVGIPASIDNDIWGSDYTLGADTAMSRVMESIDHLSSTMRSHQRIFVIEVMGRSCGWLAMMSGFSCLTDYILIPEDPPEDWRQEVMKRVTFAKEHGKPGIFIIISEGACDTKGCLIPAGDVVKHIASFDIDVRLLKLGHVQRGGPTSAFDRILGTLLGIRAFEELFDSKEDPKLVCYSKGEVQTLDLENVIEENDKIKDHEKNLEFTKILQARGKLFTTVHTFYKEFMEGKIKVDAPLMEDINLKVLLADNLKLQMKYEDQNKKKEKGEKKKVGVMQCGSRASGMNTALNSIVQYCFVANLEPVYILNGFDGLLQDQIISSKLYEFSTDYNNGGASLGLCDLKYVDVGRVRKALLKNGINNLIIIGDADCLEIVNSLKVNKEGGSNSREGSKKDGKDDKDGKEIDNNLNNNLNVILIPSASSNNIPSTDLSIGTDTALNTIVRVSDCAKLSAFSMKKSVFVLEVAGENCGFLTLMGGIAAGAFDSFIPERKYLIGHLSETAHRLRSRFKESKRNGIVLFRNERTFCSISTESFCRVLKTDGKGLFETDYAVMGRLQQGLYPSPIDRVNATLFGIKAVKCCVENLRGGMVGIKGNEVVFTDIKTALESFDLKTRTVKDPRWIKYSNISKSIE